ncbi:MULTISPECIES: NADPH-dependent F420 reductase [unclassified Caulobacter]|uniref:NADPH-dependent F420 reductase n=1 Tax=unclassified Caulobacter TaxID=2648921 RepID=UPI0006FF067C|nr:MULTISPECIES: NAD(P)-binding domain-containing protein [unclassified Caulobacter]KQV57356.1 3-hydroxyisobutyrate dehydrogenase [Caulobacter sp. Root342]KQV66928.1 3-hydroxyisobutyrate dehydrogenase [Caulobacter sp. Root343]
MKIGIIGAGNIGATLAQLLVKAGHDVKLANSKGPETLGDIVDGTAIAAVTRDNAVKDVDVIILSVPFARNPELAPVLADVPASVIIVDTSNYYPMRDGKIEEVEEGKLETVWSSEQVGRPLVKAWNALLSFTLAEAGSKNGSASRLAIPIAGDDAAAKSVVARLVDETGFDAVDAGPISESWRFQPGAPAYCTELDAAGVAKALSSADKARSPRNLELITQAFVDGSLAFEREAMVAFNRKVSG